MTAAKPLLAAAVAASLLSSAACHPSKPTDTAPRGAARSPLASPALAFLPADTPIALWAKSPRALAGAIGWKALVAKYPPLSQAAARARAQVGFNLYDPDSWPEIGLNPAGPCGFALLASVPQTTATFLSASDAARFKAFVAKMAAREGEKVHTATVGTATVLSLRGRSMMMDLLRFVIRGDEIFIVAGHGAPGQATAIATVTPARSLAGSPSFKRAVDPLTMGAFGAGYVALRPLVERELGRPLTAEESAMLPINRIGLGIDLSPNAIRTQLIALTSLPAARRVLRNGSAVPAVVRATSATPLLLAAVTIDPAALERALERDLGSAVIAEAKQAAQTSLHIDVDRDVIPLLTGEIGAAWTTSTLKLTRENTRQAFGGNLFVGVNSAARARALLARVFANPMFAGSVRRQKDGWYEIPVQGFKPVYVGVAKNQIVASTDRTIGERLGGGRSFATKVPQPGLRALLARPQPAVVFTARTALLAWMTLDAGHAASGPAAHRSPAQPGTSAAKSQPQPQPQRKPAQAGSRVRKLEGKRRALLDEARALARDTGTTAFSTRVSSGALTSEGGQFFSPGHTLPELVDRTVGLAIALRQNARALAAARLDDERKRAPAAPAPAPAPGGGGTGHP